MKEISLVTAYAIQITLYWLNGAAVFYAGLIASSIGRRANGIVDWATIEKFPFAVICFLLFIIGAAASTCALFAYSY